MHAHAQGRTTNARKFSKIFVLRALAGRFTTCGSRTETRWEGESACTCVCVCAARMLMFIRVHLVMFITKRSPCMFIQSDLRWRLPQKHIKCTLAPALWMFACIMFGSRSRLPRLARGPDFRSQVGLQRGVAGGPRRGSRKRGQSREYSEGPRPVW